MKRRRYNLATKHADLLAEQDNLAQQKRNFDTKHVEDHGELGDTLAETKQHVASAFVKREEKKQTKHEEKKIKAEEEIKNKENHSLKKSRPSFLYTLFCCYKPAEEGERKSLLSPTFPGIQQGGD